MPRPRSTLILWGKTIDQPELQRDPHIGKDIDDTLRLSILIIIYDILDTFCERGVSRPMLDFKFCLDTDNPTPICYWQPVYGFHERRMMTAQIADLEANGLIIDGEGAWGSLLLLAAKPNKESFGDINTFV